MRFKFFNDSNLVEVDGIKLKTVMPEHVIRIPPKLSGDKTQVQFGIQITNNTANPRIFLLFAVRPEFFQANRKKVSQLGPNVNGSYNPQISDFKLLMPGESMSFLLEGHFQWEENKLKFTFQDLRT
ncbi:MAG: hypothetical protein QNJ47_23990 [Nostocaceae cyanobacterium]|nr:hypothetical protein [Nostocaceae cyanobacterium]